MAKVLAWVLSFTKLDKVVTPVQKFLDGKKAYLAGAGIAIPALLIILQKFSEQGVSYLMTLASPSNPEWVALMNGIGIMGMRAAISKAVAPPDVQQ